MAKINSIKTLIKIARDHKIFLKKGRLTGIINAITGWLLIAFSTVAFSPKINIANLSASYSVMFLSGTCFILLSYLIYSAITGFNSATVKFLTISKKNENSLNNSHLSVKERIFLIYLRGLIATIGFMAYEWAKISIEKIDNSMIHGADALMYALIAWIFLKQKFDKYEYLGIFIAIAGVIFVLFQDINFHQNFAIWGYIAGIISSIALAIVILLTSITVQHDHPVRIAFHQCICGLVIATLFFVVLKFTTHNQFISHEDIKDSAIIGIYYASALILFFRAFYYVEPIIIATLGYFLPIFVVLLEVFWHETPISGSDIASFILITLGCGILVYRESRKQKPLDKAVEASRVLYLKREENRRENLLKDFKSGKLNTYEYISEMYNLNRSLFEISESIRDTKISKIHIENNTVVFVINPFGIKIQTDKSCRSAALEILNFGSYEEEEEHACFELIPENGTILDIGANIGWFSLNIAKKFPSSKIHAFEPIPMTYKILKKNITNNHCKNVKHYNFGITNKNTVTKFYYSELGSPVASEKNLFDIKHLEKISCSMRTLDDFISSEKISDISFIKCDVEGAELLALQGATNCLSKFKPILMVELVENWCNKFDYSANDVLLFLKSTGYDCYALKSGNLTSIKRIDLTETSHFNYFFIPKR